MLRFEAAVHNAEVRRLVYEGSHHPNLSDKWSDTHYIEIYARDLDDAYLRAKAKYPSDRGFVVEAVTEA